MEIGLASTILEEWDFCCVIVSGLRMEYVWISTDMFGATFVVLRA